MQPLHILTALTTQPWAMRSEVLAVMYNIAMGEGDPEQARLLRELRAERPSALAAQQGRPLDGTETVTVRDGVAILPVNGPIVRYGNMFTSVSGATSIECLARDFNLALRDPSVGAILFWFDSPGGAVTGMHNLNDMVYAARDQKPIESYSEGMCASAAYWLASATSRITCEATCDLGSIGVIMPVADPTITRPREIAFVSSQSPNKRPDPTTENGRARLQRIVDDTAEVMIADIARNRGMTPEQVIADFEQGDVLTGARAIAAGLADRIGTFEQTLADLALTAQTRRITSFRRAATTERERFSARLKENLCKS